MRGTIEPLRARGLDVETAIGLPASRSQRPTAAQRPAPALRRTVPEPVRRLARDLRLLAHGRAFRAAAFGPFDCVYERSGYLLDVGRPIACGNGVPYIVETDGILVQARVATQGAPLRRWAEWIERRKITSADLVVVPSRASRDEVSARYGVPGERTLVKGLGVEREVLDQPEVEPCVDVGWAGTFQPYHGVEILVEALGHLGARSAVLVGDGPGRAGVTSAVAGLPIELPGLLPRRDALDRLARCRVLVIPESAESVYPVKLLEYAALRRPVVCPRRRAFHEFREDDRDLLFAFEPGNPHDLARAIEAAIADQGDRAGRLHSLVARHYTWEAAAARLATGIMELVGAR